MEELLERLQTWSRGISDEERKLAVQDLQPLPLSKYLPYLPSWMRQTVVADHMLDFMLDFEGLTTHLHVQDANLMRNEVR